MCFNSRENIEGQLTDSDKVKFEFTLIFNEDKSIFYFPREDKAQFYDDIFFIIRKNGARETYNYSDLDSFGGYELEDLPFEERLQFCPNQ